MESFLALRLRTPSPFITGKLYLGGNQDALKSFKTDIDENIKKPDVYWRQLTGS
jgi:hypothetical protein